VTAFLKQLQSSAWEQAGRLLAAGRPFASAISMSLALLAVAAQPLPAQFPASGRCAPWRGARPVSLALREPSPAGYLLFDSRGRRAS